jgi:phage gpG-like protein
MISFNVKVNDRRVEDALNALYRRSTGSGLRRLMVKIAAVYEKQVADSFDLQRDPGLRPWRKNTQATRRLKQVGMKGRGKAIMGDSHVGVWTGKLATSIKVEITGNQIKVGSDLPHAPWFQNGHKGWHNSTIPARPFLGRAVRTDNAVLNLLRQHFSGESR